MATIRSLSPINPVSTLVLDAFEMYAPVFNDIDAYQRGGNADSIKKAREGSNLTSIFRALNNKENRSAPTPNYTPVTKKIVSGDARVDKILEQRNEDVDTELAYETRISAEADAKVFQEKAFLADSGVDANEFDGIVSLVPGARNVDLSNPLILPVGGDASKSDQQVFFETFMERQAVMPYQEFHCYMNEQLRYRMLTAAKNLGYYNSIDSPDGKIEKIGKAIIKGFGYKADGTTILPFDQTVAGHTETSSLLFVKWGERTDLTFVTSAGLVADYLGIVDTKYYSNGWDLDGAFGLQNDHALYKLNGVALKYGV